MQLQGPVPEALYHRYVEFRPFVAGMFTSHSLRGRLLNRTLHHQHARVYNYDRSTLYGLFPKPCEDMTKQFLDFVHYDQGGRIFTYIITLDAQWRFTETGKEFGIDLLSKHTMHSNVSIYIAFSGEFFIRRLKKPDRVERGESENKLRDGKGGDPSQDLEAPGPDQEDDNRPSSAIARDPAHYELLIDNDSGTYRPNAKLLNQLREFMERNLPGLRVTTLDCQGDEEKMTKLKTEQRDRKKAAKGGEDVMYQQNASNSDTSLSSSEVDEQAAQPEHGESNANANGPAGGATKAKVNNAREKATGFKKAASQIKHMTPNPTAVKEKDAQEGEGGFVGENAPVLEKEKATGGAET